MSHKIKSAAVLVVLLTTIVGCHKSEKLKEEEKPLRDISEVLQAHSAKLLAEPEVAGFYEGRLEDGRPCITVKLKSDNEESKKRIPKTLEGYPVIIEVTGEIKPMH